MEERRSRTWATVLVDDRGSCRCCATTSGGTATPRTELDDGRARVRVAAPTPLDIARNLAGWGALVEVEGPPEVRAELARIGAELTARYAAEFRVRPGRIDAWHALGSSATRGSPPG